MSLVTDAILEKINSLIVVVNHLGEVEYVSPSAKRILGYEPEQLMGQGWWNLTRYDQSESKLVRELALKQVQGREQLQNAPYERLLKTAGGNEKWILWNTSAGPMNTLVGIGHDITERKKAEEKMSQSHFQLAVQNKEMLDSINYASRIQNAILPDVNEIKKHVGDAFVFYQPKNVVSGDYFFFHASDEKLFVAAVDCTGHGVPGALMSVIANGLLKDVIVKKGVTDPSEIMYALDAALEKVWTENNKTETSSDGMDIALLVIDKKQKTFRFAGAFRPLLLLRSNEITEFAGSRFPIGHYADIKKTFNCIEESYEANDTFYLFSDGFPDQFGGEDKRKFNKKRFKELLLTAATMEMDEQESFLQYALNNWKQQEIQTDDILVLGLKIS